jgi:hypothetical protein
MELAGLEPATSWVRSRQAEIVELRDLQDILYHLQPGIWSRMPVDSCRFPPFQALLAMSA